jgi:RNA polymerase sigma-70 factor (ECF subfamily)
LDELEDDLRSVFILAELEEMTMASISKIIGVPAGTVASRLRRARSEFNSKAAAVRRRLAEMESR